MSVINDLRNRRAAILSAAQAIANPAAAANRALTDSEHEAYVSAVAELDALDERIAGLRSAETRQREAEDVHARLTGGVSRRGTGDSAEIGDAFRSAILERNPRPIDVRWDAPRSYYQPGVERRDLLTTAPPNFSPVSFYGQMVAHLVESSAVLRAGATLVTTDSGEPLRVPRSTALSTAAIVAEGAAIPESDPALGVVTLGAHKYGVLVQVSSELAQDSGVDLPGYLARETGQAIGLAVGNHLINGTGTGQPRGVLADSTAGATGPTGTATSFGAQGTAGQGTDLLYDLHGSLAEPYAMQPAAGWLLRNATLTSIRKLKTTAGEQEGGAKFVTDPPAGSAASASMIGKPAYVDPFVPAMAANAKSVLFGDWSRYFVRMVNGVRFERSDDFAFSTDMVTFRALLRLDGALVDTTGAIKHFAHSAT